MSVAQSSPPSECKKRRWGIVEADDSQQPRPKGGKTTGAKRGSSVSKPRQFQTQFALPPLSRPPSPRAL